MYYNARYYIDKEELQKLQYTCYTFKVNLRIVEGTSQLDYGTAHARREEDSERRRGVVRPL